MAHDLPLTTAQLIALGRVVAESSKTEAWVNFILNVLTRLNLFEFDLLIHRLKHHEKLQALKALGLKKLRSKKKQAKFSQIIDRLSNLNTDRNIAVHGQWEPIGGPTLGESLGGFGPDHELRPAHAVNRKGKGKTTNLSAKRLEDLADNIATHCEELVGFWTTNWLTSRQKEAIEAIWKRQGNPARFSP